MPATWQSASRPPLARANLVLKSLLRPTSVVSIIHTDTPNICTWGPRMRVNSNLWIGTAVTLVLMQAAASAFLHPGLALTAVSDILDASLMLGLVVVFAGNAAHTEGRLRSVWILQSLSWSFWLADQGAWIFYDIVLRKPMPAMFPGDIVLFLAGVPMLAGLLLRPHLQPRKRAFRLSIVDFLQLMLWWIYIYVYLVMCWLYISPNLSLYNNNFDRLYLVQIIVLMTTIGLLLKASQGSWRHFYALFMSAVAFNSLTVVAENTAIEQAVYYNGSWYDVGFAVSLALFMLVAVKGRSLDSQQEASQSATYGRWMSKLAALAVLSLPAVVVVNMVATTAYPEIAHFRVLITAATMFAMYSLVLVKQSRLHAELRQMNTVLEDASMTDPLTGVRNRRFFSTTIENDIAQTIRAFAEGQDLSSRDLVFYLIDLDNFKDVNETYGHDAGDRVLIEAVQRIHSAIRVSDVLIRWGGEEFLVISRFTDRRQAGAAARRLVETIRCTPFAVGPSKPIQQRCSVGWAAFPWIEKAPGAMGYEEVLKLADRALGQAKKEGKDRALGIGPTFDALNPSETDRRSIDPLLGALCCPEPFGLPFPSSPDRLPDDTATPRRSLANSGLLQA
jgi:diguanylate cyclase (GGDEF)-like protein